VAFLHGKTIRERALALIEIAHPKFRPWLLAECKSRNLVYRDQIEMPFRTPSYPAHLERWVEIREGARVYLRPLKLTDEPRVRDLFYKLSPESVRSRFFQLLKALPHEQLQNLLRVDYEKDMALVALNDATETSTALAIAHYRNDPQTNFAEAAFLVLDEWQGKGIGSALLDSLVEMARQQGIAGFSAEVLSGNHGMMCVFHKCGYPVESRLEEGVYHLRIPFTRRGRARLPAPASSGKPSAPPT
jgi:GNAT superfamily N-acetyltransferase